MLYVTWVRSSLIEFGFKKTGIYNDLKEEKIVIAKDKFLALYFLFARCV